MTSTTETATTPDAVSNLELQEAADSAYSREENMRIDAIMEEGRVALDFVCEAGLYNRYTQVEAVAAKALYNLMMLTERKLEACREDLAKEGILEHAQENYEHIKSAFIHLLQTL